ncbi:hypothetical protein [Leucobacter sp. 1207-22]|uniref:hypothetical protein n=1 Tax=Leucobacter sp. 1207-22 TaxID=2604456 RepID=UPI004063C611
MSITALTTWALETETEFDANAVSPGVEGFLFTALFAAAVIVLGFLLVRRIRRSQYRAEVREDIANELAGGEASATPDANPTA